MCWYSSVNSQADMSFQRAQFGVQKWVHVTQLVLGQPLAMPNDIIFSPPTNRHIGLTVNVKTNALSIFLFAIIYLLVIITSCPFCLYSLLRTFYESDYTRWKMNLYVLIWRSQTKIRRPKSPKFPLDLTLMIM